MSESRSERSPRTNRSLDELIAAKHARPIRSVDELAADTFDSDEELDEFLAFTYAERHANMV
ncbi:hypothetical protein ACIBEJ_20280 [Nonomuraea sp. NPDC050790]|uniref:hypothetical protein n=1 Tax=Nonomuraea sp. NPDC050790 TaxID=3364371 RepID=UPI00378CC61C